MQKEAEPEIKGQPGQVEERRRADARQEAAHGVEVAQGLQSLARRVRPFSGRRDDDVEDAAG